MGEAGYSYCEEQLRHAADAAENCERAYLPPVGATPYYITARDRINELLSAIGRYMNEPGDKLTREMIKSAKLWSIELTEQIDTYDTLHIWEH